MLRVVAIGVASYRLHRLGSGVTVWYVHLCRVGTIRCDTVRAQSGVGNRHGTATATAQGHTLARVTSWPGASGG
jgi:hypothetical protein